MPLVSVKMPEATKAKMAQWAARRGLTAHAVMAQAIETECMAFGRCAAGKYRRSQGPTRAGLGRQVLNKTAQRHCKTCSLFAPCMLKAADL